MLFTACQVPISCGFPGRGFANPFSMVRIGDVLQRGAAAPLAATGGQAKTRIRKRSARRRAHDRSRRAGIGRVRAGAGLRSALVANWPRARRAHSSSCAVSNLICVSVRSCVALSMRWTGRPAGHGMARPGGRWTGPPPLARGNPCQKYLGPKIPRVQGFAIALLAKASQTIPSSRRRSLWQR